VAAAIRDPIPGVPVNWSAGEGAVAVHMGGAVERTLEDAEDASLSFGVDVARFGADKSALAVWQGKSLLSVITKDGLDTMAVSSWISSEIHRQKPSRVRVDEIGIGAGVVDRLRQLRHEIEAVSVSRAAIKPELFANLRAELHWALREALEKGEVSLPGDEKLSAEFSSLRYSYSNSGQIVVEKKEQAKKRLGHSPDRSDAAILGFASAASEPGRLALVGGYVVDLVAGRRLRRFSMSLDEPSW